MLSTLLDSLCDAAAVISCASDGSLQLLGANRTWRDTFGGATDSTQPQPLSAPFSQETVRQLAQAAAQCSLGQIPQAIQATIALVAGARTFSLQLSVLGNPTAGQMLLVARDVSDAVAAASRAASYRSILDQTSDLIAHFDRHGHILFFNTPLLKAMNFTEAHAVGRTWPEAWPESSDAHAYHNAVLEAVRSGSGREAEVVFDLPAGRTWFQIRSSPGRNAAGEVISVTTVARDITALKQAEDRLRQSEHQFRALAENSPDSIMRFDRERRLIYCNPQMERATGISFDRFLGKNIDELRVHAPIPTSAGAAEPIGEALARVLRLGVPQELELREPHPLNPGGIIYSNFILAPERDASGNVTSVLAIGRDITPLKTIEADLRLLNATLEERVASRTADLELANRDLKSFAYTVSHDLRAPLRAIIGFAMLVKEEEQERLSASGKSLLDRVAAAAMKLNRLIEDILEYSHAGQVALSPRSVSLEQLGQDVVAELHAQYPNAAISVGDLPRVSGDPTMLRQVVQNLIGNALKFSAQREQPEVEFDWVLEDGHPVFYVRDNGAGFDMRYAHVLGSMFQRLHNEREFPGSGVGLAIVQRLVERHGGRLWAKSEPGAGATFFFTLSSANLSLQIAR